MRKIRKNKIVELIFEHIRNNSKEYIFVLTIFIMGIFLGVMFSNNSSKENSKEIIEYFENYINSLKNTEILSNGEMIKANLLRNIFVGTLLWFFGTTIIGIPMVLGIILYRGFCLGYTISTIIITLGLGKGIGFILSMLVLQNILFIPAIIAIAVSGIKLYKYIFERNNITNIKVEILRHSVFSGIMILILVVSAIIEILISTNFFKKIVKYF